VATRYFSLDEAQALVPQVRSLLGRALQLHGHLRVAIARLSQAGYEVTWAMLRGEDPLRPHADDDEGEGEGEGEGEVEFEGEGEFEFSPGVHEPRVGPMAGSELPELPPRVRDLRAAQALERTRMIYTTLRETVAEIEALGAAVKGVVDGLVDFHSWCDGEREVLLCWKLGESEIGFFHATDEGFSARQPIRGHRFTAAPELSATGERGVEPERQAELANKH
jgi:hypothetical protein